jgi:hypothetical protein
MAGLLRVPRSRGALSGVLLVLLGAWGALIAFIGPYFHYAFTPDRAWAYTSGRLWLEILPGAATLLAGLIVLLAATRPTAVFGAWVAAMSGAWFVVGRPLSTLWTTGGTTAGGNAVGGHIARAVEDIGFFTGLGVVILFFAAMALGRFTVIGAREAGVAAAQAEAADQSARRDTTPADTDQTGSSLRARLPHRTRQPAATAAGTTASTPDGTVVDEPVGKHSVRGTNTTS